MEWVCHARCRKTQAGHSLVSLLLSVSIGLILTGGAIKLYIAARLNTNYHHAQSVAVENGRYAIEDIRRVLMMAGRGLSPDSPPEHVFGTYDNSGESDKPDLTDSPDGDALRVVYRGAPNCVGQEPGTNEFSSSRFDVKKDTFKYWNLYCSAGIGHPAALASGNRSSVVSGIHNLQVLYGIDLDSDNYANQYLDGAAVDQSGNWSSVVSVRIGILAGSDGFTIPTVSVPDPDQSNEGNDAAFSKQFTVLNQMASGNEPDLAYRSFSTTVALRNLIGIARQPVPLSREPKSDENEDT